MHRNAVKPLAWPWQHKTKRLHSTTGFVLLMMFLSPRVKGSSGLNLGQGHSTTQPIVVISIHAFGHGDQKPQVGLALGPWRLAVVSQLWGPRNVPWQARSTSTLEMRTTSNYMNISKNYVLDRTARYHPHTNHPGICGVYSKSQFPKQSSTVQSSYTSKFPISCHNHSSHLHQLVTDNLQLSSNGYIWKQKLHLD